MTELIRELLAPYYIYIKFIHLFFVMMWSWSTTVAYLWFAKVAYLKWKKDPENEELVRRRNWAFEQFDRGAVIEHTAFPIIMLTGPLLYWLGNWTMDANWLMVKLSIVLLLFIPIEIADYYLSHFGGNKYAIRKSNQPEKYERFIHIHWRFFQLTTPIIQYSVPTVLFLAIVKPF